MLFLVFAEIVSGGDHECRSPGHTAQSWFVTMLCCALGVTGPRKRAGWMVQVDPQYSAAIYAHRIQGRVTMTTDTSLSTACMELSSMSPETHPLAAGVSTSRWRSRYRRAVLQQV